MMTLLVFNAPYVILLSEPLFSCLIFHLVFSILTFWMDVYLQLKLDLVVKYYPYNPLPVSWWQDYFPHHLMENQMRWLK